MGYLKKNLIVEFENIVSLIMMSVNHELIIRNIASYKHEVFIYENIRK